MVTTAIDISEFAQDWVSSMPRTLLGSFASDRTLVARWFAVWTHSRNLYEDCEGDVPVRLAEMLEYASERMPAGWNEQDPVSEILMWLSYTEDDYYPLAVKDFCHDSAVVERSEFLLAVVSTPGGLPYFEAGATSAAEVKRCIDEGIDVSLAQDLFRGAA